MQIEIKLVYFKPTSGHYAVDIYVNGDRQHCGRGHLDIAAATKEAVEWLTGHQVEMD